MTSTQREATTDEVRSPVLDTAPLPTSGPWPTLDPFLFCVHHVDAYPRSDGRLAPAADLSGRTIGNDFSSTDGWSMYHGDRVPGFPQHPHRGFETVTFVRSGLVDHADSMGATARYGRGDVQWLTAGGGIVHSEMFPLVHCDAANPLEMFQIWLNLPAAAKMSTPHFKMLWAEGVPTVVDGDEDRPHTRVTVAAGEYGGHRPSAPPPDSWASAPGSDVAIWLAEMDDGATWEIPVAAEGTNRALYVPHHAGGSVSIGSPGGDTEVLGSGSMAVVDPAQPLAVQAHEAAQVLVLQGRPIGEPVAQYGPFVMNDQAGIRQTFEDYRRTGFGGWQWAEDGPTHGPDAGRFAVHADGTLDEPPR